MVRPKLAFNHDVLLMVVAAFGTTISPCLFFWRAAQEMDGTSDSAPHTPQDVPHHLRRIKADTIIDMTFSNLIACECRRHGECHAGHALKPC